MKIGFVCYADRESAINAKNQLDKIVFKNRILFVAQCEPREKRQLMMEEKVDMKLYQR